MAYMGRKGAAAPLTSADIQNDTITSAKIVADTILASDLADEVGVETTHHKIPVHANDAARNSAIGSPANGMLIYNTSASALQQYNGAWSTIAPAPNITAVSGFLNNDNDSTITVFGTNFTSSTAVKMFDASSGGSQIGSDATTTFNSSSKLTAVFGAGSIGASGSTAYIEVDSSGSTNRFVTVITVNADPTVVHAGATGTSANTTTHLGTYTGTSSFASDGVFTIASAAIPTITFTGSATQLAADEDIEFTSVINTTKASGSQHLTDTGIGLTLTNLTGSDKSKATLTGSIPSPGSHSGMALKAQVRKSLGDAAYNNSTLVTFSGSTTTVGLAPGMPVTGTGISIAGPLTCGLTNTDATVTAASTTGLVVGMQVNAFTGVPAGATILSIITNTSFELSANATATDADAKLTFNTIISAVASTTTLTLSNVTTLGAQTGNTLIFEDLTRVAHVNGSEVLATGDAMLSIVMEGANPVLFNARTYTGTGVARSITGMGFQPDLVYIRARSSAEAGHFYDSVRGATKVLHPSSAGIELTNEDADEGGVTSFDADGFTTTADTGGDGVNGDTVTHVAWGWEAGGAPTAVNSGGQTPTSGSAMINGAVATGTQLGGTSGNYPTSSIYPNKLSANTAGGFAMVQYTKNATAGATVPHGLGVAPEFMMFKDIANGNNWMCYHVGMGNTKYMSLDTDGAEATSTTRWNDTTPSTTHFTLGVSGHVNGPDGSGGYMGYLFASKAGVSKIGTYTGVANTDPHTITGLGFRPRFIMIKSVAGSRGWVIADTVRGFGTSGSAGEWLMVDDTLVAYTGSALGFTTTTDGWTMATDNGHVDYSGTYIYAAFA